MKSSLMNVSKEQFEMDVLDMEDIVNKCIDDGALTIGTEHDLLFIQVMDKNAFGEDLVEKYITMKMKTYCMKMMHDKDLLCLFIHAYVRNDYVVCFGVTGKKGLKGAFFDVSIEYKPKY